MPLVECKVTGWGLIEYVLTWVFLMLKANKTSGTEQVKISYADKLTNVPT